MKTNYCTPECKVWEIKTPQIISTSQNAGLRYGQDGGAGSDIDEKDVINGGNW